MHTENYDWSNKILLVAEDEEVNFIYFVEAMESTKAKILRAFNGLEAVNLVKENNNISLVLLDIKMPIMDGIEAVAEIKKIRKNLPVIAQTAYAMPGEKEIILKAGCDDYVSKPILRTDLLDLINTWMSKS